MANRTYECTKCGLLLVEIPDEACMYLCGRCDIEFIEMIDEQGECYLLEVYNMKTTGWLDFLKR